MKNRHYIFIIFLVFLYCIPFWAQAQQLPEETSNPNDLFNNRNYSKALVYLLGQYEKHKSNDLVLKIADCYRHIQNYREAEKWYEKAMSLPKVSSDTRFYYAEVLQNNEKYLKAIKQYLLSKPKGEVLQKLKENRIFSCEYADSILRAPLRFVVKNAGDVNTSFSEFGVVPYGNGNIIVSDRPERAEDYKLGIPNAQRYGWTDRGYLHLFYGKGDSTRILLPLDLYESIVKTEYHIGPIVFNKAQNRVFFTITRLQNLNKLKNHFTKNADLVNRLEIYYSHKINGVWTKAMPLPFNSPAYSVGHPAISPDQKFLYFASDMPGGFGGIDLWYAPILDNDSFGKPINLGNTINTEGNEEFPVFQPNGVLYFSSDGLVGLGGLDLFRTRGEKTHWMIPDNLGYPLNHSADDFGLISEPRDSIEGYYGSNREGGKGADDIYTFLQIKPLPPLLRARGDTSKTDSLKEIEFEKKTFPSDSLEYIATYQLKNIPVPFNIDSVSAINKAISEFLHSKYVYHFHRTGNTLSGYNLDSTANQNLDSIAQILAAHPKIKLEIIGHTDIRGSELTNRALSDKRAKAAFDRLVALGINPKRMKAEGVASAIPVKKCLPENNCSDEDHAENRKTEFIVPEIGNSFTFDDSDRVVSTDTSIYANYEAIKRIVIKRMTEKNYGRLHDSYVAAFGKSNPAVENAIACKIGILCKIDAKVGSLRARKETGPRKNELFDAFSEMSIESVNLTSKNLLVIKEIDGTIQKILMPGYLLHSDQAIKDVDGREWVVRKDRKVVRIR